MAKFTLVLTLVAALALAHFAQPAQADLSAFLASTKAERGVESIPDHPRACSKSDRYCFYNADPDQTFGEFAEALAEGLPNVTAEDIIRYSGWAEYVDDKVLTMDKMYYAVSVGPDQDLVAHN